LQIQRLANDNDIPRRLIEAASEVFARHGYAGTRVREIVRAADVNLASVNYYFGGKEGLYAATLNELAAQRVAVPAAALGAESSTTDHERLFRVVLAILQRYVDGNRKSTLGRILAHESMNPTVYFERLIADIVRPELDRLRQVLEAIAAGRLDPDAMTRSAMSIMGQCLFYLFARGAVDRLHPGFIEAQGVEALARHIVDFSLGGLEGAITARKRST
jgi:AcrR family transcriptional regulator